MAAYDATGLLPRILERLANRYGGNLVGATLIIVSSLTAAAMMAAVKDLTVTYTVWQILFVRSLGQVILLTPLIARRGGEALKSERFDLQILRVVFAFAANTCTFYAIAHLPLAEASAISFSRVIFVVALAAIIFADRAGVVGWGATVIGLVGVIVMLDPTADALNDAAGVGAAGALAAALNIITIKKLTETDSTATIMCYPAIGFTLLSGIPSIMTWEPITWAAAPLFVLAMVSGTFTHWCFVNAYRHGEASIMGTVDYSRLISAAMVGFVIFSEVPTPDALAGIGLIITASFIAVRRDQIRAWIARLRQS